MSSKRQITFSHRDLHVQEMTNEGERVERCVHSGQVLAHVLASSCLRISSALRKCASGACILGKFWHRFRQVLAFVLPVRERWIHSGQVLAHVLANSCLRILKRAAQMCERCVHSGQVLAQVPAGSRFRSSSARTVDAFGGRPS